MSTQGTDTNENATSPDEQIRRLIHEIKNPLSTIYLAIDSLKNAKDDGEDPEIYIQLLEKSARKLDSVINEWLEKKG
jgi:nitrogen-specific signal transduction histidine kinase